MSTDRNIDRNSQKSDVEFHEPRTARSAPVPSFRIGDILLDRGLITDEQLHEVLQRQQSSGDRIGTCLLQLGLIDEETLAQTLSEQYKIPYVNLDQVEPDKDAVCLIPKKLSLQCQAIPLSRTGRSLLVAMLDPSNLSAIHELKFASGLEIQMFVAPESQIRQAIQKFYDEAAWESGDVGSTGPEAVDGEVYDRLLRSELSDGAVEVIDEMPETVDVSALESMSGEDRVVDLANLILLDAVRRHASDIHLEPYDREFRLRFRTEGQLVNVMRLPLAIKDALTSRLKIMARLDITERRIPQDGRIRLNMRLSDGVKAMDFRVSVLPTLFGEKIVMRVLDKSNLMFDMGGLGLDHESLTRFQRAIHEPFGLILVTGPTGSGKTNTLYSAISQINEPDMNILTAEDPVEFTMRGVNQVQINERSGMTFAAALRSFLRQDPDVVLIGEMRDRETADMAIKASLTGHLVLSTLHTNSAPGAIDRLLNMDIEPFLIASSLQLICAQRLVRRICNSCKESVSVVPSVLRAAGFANEELERIKLQKGRGCDQCHGSGYKGRVGLYEVMEINDDIRKLIIEGASVIEIREAAERNGMITLRASGLQKVRDGVTSLEQVIQETSLSTVSST